MASRVGAVSTADVGKLVTEQRRKREREAAERAPVTAAPAAAPTPLQPARPVLDVVAEVARLAGLPLVCEPSAEAEVLLIGQPHARALERTLDNIFSNIARDGTARVQGRGLQLTWTVQGDQFRARLLTPHLSAPWPQRPFEPMQTAGGSGLGLYQARLSLRDVGGELTAETTPEGIAFAWHVTLLAQRQFF